MEAENKEKTDPLDDVPTFHDFTQSTSIHGVNRVFDTSIKIKLRT